MDITKTEFIEARQFFRIDDSINLTYRLASTDELTAPNYAFDIMAIDEKHQNLLQALEILNKGADEILNKIADSNALIANYLRVMDHKILLVTKSLIYKVDLKREKPRLVNLSEAGIAFGTNDELALDSHIRITLLLTPIADEIALYGKILRLDSATSNRKGDTNYRYWVAVQFTNMQNTDRQLLARYILYKQIAQRQG